MKTPAALSRLAWFSKLMGVPVKNGDELGEEEKKTELPRIGLCLSSGGARGLAHVGVIQVLEEENIPITAIAGSSMGAYVGSLWAAGANGARLEELAREMKDRRTLLQLLDPVFPPCTGLVRGYKVRKHLERDLGKKDFSDLSKPLLVVATNLDTMSPVIFDKGNVASAVHASAAIPGFVAPLFLNGVRYVDGGVCEPLPVTPLRRGFGLDHVIAVNVMPTPADIIKNPAVQSSSMWNPMNWINLMAPGNVMDTFRRALMAAQIQIASREAEHADVVLHPFFYGSRWYDFEHFDRYIQAGREAARDALPQIRALLEKKPTTKGGYYETAPSHTTLGLVNA